MSKEIKMLAITGGSWMSNITVKGIFDGEVLIKEYAKADVKTVGEMFSSDDTQYALELPVNVLAKVKKLDNDIAELQKARAEILQNQCLTKGQFLALFNDVVEVKKDVQ